MQKIFANKIVALIVTFLVILFLFSLRKTRLKSDYSNRILRQKQQSLTQLRKDLQQLKQKDTRLGSDFYQEKIIRDELLMQRPREIIIQLPIEEEKRVVNSSPKPDLQNLEKWEKLLSF